MYELCAFMNAAYPVKKASRPRGPRKPQIKVGAACIVKGKHEGVVTRRDERFKGAWFVAFDKGEAPFSFSAADIKLL